MMVVSLGTLLLTLPADSIIAISQADEAIFHDTSLLSTLQYIYFL